MCLCYIGKNFLAWGVEKIQEEIYLESLNKVKSKINTSSCN